VSTIADVARAAGVSVATVSRVINDTAAVKDETAARVRDAIDELSYIPNISARNLRRRESRTVLVLAPNFSNPYNALVLAGICDRARDLGYITIIHNTYDALAINEKSLKKMITSNRVDGTITLACNREDKWLEKFRDDYPLVLCSEYVSDTRLPHLSVDNNAAAYEAVSYLTALGHRRIAFLGTENQYLSTEQRFAGYRQALKDADVMYKAAYVEKGSADYSYTSGKAAAEKLLRLPERPTAIFCVSDVFALGVMTAATELGLTVPRDLSIIGFDDADCASMFLPGLTTVRVPCYDLGRESMSLLVRRIRKGKDAVTGAFLPYTFVKRGSCGAAEEEGAVKASA
jgi:DNA-binding LacI/PurR family transcriptional regulator